MKKPGIKKPVRARGVAARPSRKRVKPRLKPKPKVGVKAGAKAGAGASSAPVPAAPAAVTLVERTVVQVPGVGQLVLTCRSRGRRGAKVCLVKLPAGHQLRGCTGTEAGAGAARSAKQGKLKKS